MDVMKYFPQFIAVGSSRVLQYRMAALAENRHVPLFEKKSTHIILAIS
jgi:hypothetical protein